jgi:hypothetical protein
LEEAWIGRRDRREKGVGKDSRTVGEKKTFHGRCEKLFLEE